MKIIVNGEETEINESLTLEEFLRTKRISKEDKGIAVAVNDSVVRKDEWNTIKLDDGMVIEIVRAVQGGLV